jgi:hypothetical protein
LEIRRRVLGPEHPDTPKSMSHLAGVYDAHQHTAKSRYNYSRALPCRWYMDAKSDRV